MDFVKDSDYGSRLVDSLLDLLTGEYLDVSMFTTHLLIFSGRWGPQQN